MASTKYYIQGKKQSVPIYLRFSDSSNFNIKRKTGLFINPSSWSKATNYPIAKDETTKSIKTKLMKLESFVIENFNEDNAVGKIIDGKWLERVISKYFNRADFSNPFESVSGTIDYIVNNAHTRKNGKGSIGLSYNRIKGYKNLKVVLSKYNRNKDIPIKAIDRLFINDFADWLIHTELYKISTANKKISDLKGICFEAESHGIAISNQLRHISALTERRKEEVIILNREELDKIWKKEVENKSLANVKKWLLFGCEIGQRLDDLLNITQENIQKSRNGNFRVLKLTQQKGNKMLEIPLNPTAEKIISDGLPYKISKVNFNKYVKKLCEKCEINEELMHSIIDPDTNRKKYDSYKKYQLITGHTCRRSFASNYYGQMANSLIMKVTGHTTEKTFLKYIGKKEEDFSELIYQEMKNTLKPTK